MADLISFGANDFGQGATGTASPEGPDGFGANPTPAFGVASVPFVASGGAYPEHGLLIDAAGDVYAWGHNHSGKLGQGTEDNDPHPTPLLVEGLPSLATKVALGPFHSVALLDDGTVWAWGANNEGQIGDGTFFVNRTTPVQVLASAGVPLTNVVDLVAGESLTAFLMADGTVQTCGLARYNGRGAPGGLQLYPLPAFGPGGVGLLSDVSLLCSAGGAGNFVLVQVDGGDCYGWGFNRQGQVGIGTSFDLPPGGGPLYVPYPTAVLGIDGVGTLSGVRDLSIGARGSLALLADGTLAGWGQTQPDADASGAAAGVTQVPYPIAVPSDPGGWVQISRGGDHALLRRNDDTVWAFGWNYAGQLGQGVIEMDDTYWPTPVQVPGISDAVRVAAGGLASWVLGDMGAGDGQVFLG